VTDELETPGGGSKFDFSSYPADTLFHERRGGGDRRSRSGAKNTPAAEPTTNERTGERRRTERRRRVDPTTFEKQYTPDELEFMNAMQRFKVQTGKAFPSYGETLRVAVSLGYRQAVIEPEEGEGADAKEGLA